jgi:hypothetical protein
MTRTKHVRDVQYALHLLCLICYMLVNILHTYLGKVLRIQVDNTAS